jgi:hypothetical protein
MRNEIETKFTETKRNLPTRNEIERKRNKTVSFRFDEFRFDLFRFVSFRFVSFRFDFISHFTGTQVLCI